MDQFNGLSIRERDVVKLLLEGKSNKLIASALHITENTVEFHLKNIYSKYQVSSRTELIIKLGNSVVADKEKIVENRDRLNIGNWFSSLRTAVAGAGEELKMENLMGSKDHRGANPLTFYEAILVCLRKYAEFKGRASRSEFWWFTLFILLVTSALAYASQTLASIFLIATLLPLLAAGARRLHDTGKSAWWELFLLVPVGGLVLVGILWSYPSTRVEPDPNPPEG